MPTRITTRTVTLSDELISAVERYRAKFTEATGRRISWPTAFDLVMDRAIELVLPEPIPPVVVIDIDGDELVS